MKKRIFAFILALVMVLSMMPTLTFAEEETAAEGAATEEAADSQDAESAVEETLGIEAELGDTLYYIEDGNLLSSVDSARPETVDADVVWVRERDGLIYYAKIDGNNTDIYKSGDGGFEKYARLFCPIDAFDVEDVFLYYSYNGEVFKLDVETGKEETVMVDSELKRFYVEGNQIIYLSQWLEMSENNDNRELLDLVQFSPLISRNDIANNTRIPLYDSTEKIKYHLLISPNAYVQIPMGDLFAHTFSNGQKGYKFTVNNDNVYAKKSDIAKGFNVWNVTKENLNDYTNFLTSSDSGNKWSIVRTTEDVLTTYYLQDKYKNQKTYLRGQPSATRVNLFKWLKHDVFTEYNVTGKTSGGGWYIVSSAKTKDGKMYYDGFVAKEKIDKYYEQRYTVTTMKTLQSGNYISPNGAKVTYLANNYTTEKSSNVTFSNVNYPSGNLTKGSIFNLTGTIYSTNNLTTILGEVINANTGIAETYTSFSPVVKGNSLNIYSSKLNYGLKFETLSDGPHYIKYTVWDSSYSDPGTWKSPTFNVVANASSAPTPSVWVESIEYGQRLVMQSSGTGAQLHMTFNGGEHSGYDTITYDFISPGTYYTDTWTTKGRAVSGHVYHTISVPKCATPWIGDAQFNASDATVVISGSGEIHYTTDGSTPTKASPIYTGPIHLTNSCTIKAISAQWGCANSDVAEKWQNISPPDAPSITLNTKDKLAQGKTTSVSWQPTARATGYTAIMYRSGVEVSRVTTTGTSASFLLSDRSDTENFEYKIKVYATNFKGNSPDSNTATVWGMHPVLVTFKDHIVRSGDLTEDKLNEVKRRIGNHDGEAAGMTVEGNVLSVQKVDYDEYPNKPSTPSKKGFTFAGWTAGLYEPAITDKTVYGEFDINYYHVSFYDVGNDNVRYDTALSSATYMYTDEAVVPENYVVPEGYLFGGWSIDNAHSTGFDLTYIDGDIVADAAYSWANEELKVFIRIDSLMRDDDSYKVQVSIKNNPMETTQGRVIVALYTAGGRNVYTQICEQDVRIGNLREWTAQPEITLLYNQKITYAKAFVVAVDHDKTGGALSAEAMSDNITYDSQSHFWTDWSEYAPTKVTESDSRQVKTEIQYRYRDKQFTTTNNTKSKDGWNYWYSDADVRGEVYNGTNWVGAENSDYKTRTVRSNWVAPQYKTQYHYFRYYKGYSAPWTHYSSSHPYFEEYWVDYQLPWLRYDGGMNQYGDGYTGNSGNKHWLICDGSTYGGPGPWTRSVLVRDGYTEYWYQDTYYTHHFWKWGDWSDWSYSSPASNGNREIESRTVYSYRDVSTDGNETEAEDGYKKTIEGALPDMGTEYITEEVYNEGKHEYISGPYYVKDADAESEADKYILVADSNRDATEYRYGRWTNGTYVMPCRECAEELYGGEWHLEWTEWSEEAAETVNEDTYACDNHPEHDHNTGRYEEGMDYWNEYVIDGESYCFVETRNENKEITYEDTTKYYKVKTSLEGDVATVMIYKKTNTDPTQAQLQYVNQILIGAGNTYQIEANTKEMIDYFGTGDFIVTLALEGGKRLINVDVIPAEAPRYKVRFYVNGNEYTTCEVSHGKAVDINEFSFDDIEALYPGYKFVKWDKSVVDVTEDMDVNAIMMPKTYSVVFVDYENQTTELLELAYGETLPDPEVKDVPGKVFLGWENTQAIFVAAPENLAEIEGLDLYYLLDDEETYIKVSEYDRTVHRLKDDTKYYKTTTSATVTGNMIVTAQWKTLEYSVKFVDLDGKVISNQTVPYGKAAELPDFIVKDGIEYTWDLTGGEWWNVTGDMVIRPYDPTPSKVAPPVLEASLEGGGGTFYASLSAADENSKIYYTYFDEITDQDAKAYIEGQQIEESQEEETGEVNLFGITLFDEGNEEETYEDFGGDDAYSIMDSIQEYTEPIEISEGTVIYAFTVDQEGNISPITVFEYGYDLSEDEGIIENTYEIDPDCPQITTPSLSVQPGETVTVPVSIKNNPGVTNLSLLFGYDAENLTLVSAENGDVFRSSEYSADIREDGSCKFTWLSQSVNDTDGTLLTLTFKAGATAGKEKITMNIEEAVAPDEEEQPFAIQDGLIRNVGDELRYGDLNGDGSADFADAILMIRYDTGEITLTDEQKKYADVNGDGEVDFADAIRVMRFDAGLIMTLR